MHRRGYLPSLGAAMLCRQVARSETVVIVDGMRAGGWNPLDIDDTEGVGVITNDNRLVRSRDRGDSTLATVSPLPDSLGTWFASLRFVSLHVCL